MQRDLTALKAHDLGEIARKERDCLRPGSEHRAQLVDPTVPVLDELEDLSRGLREPAIQERERVRAL